MDATRFWRVATWPSPNSSIRPRRGLVTELAAQVADRVAELLRADIVASDDLIFDTKAAARICGLSPTNVGADAFDGARPRRHLADRNKRRLPARRAARMAAVPSALWPPRPGIGAGRRWPLRISTRRISNRRRTLAEAGRRRALTRDCPDEKRTANV